MIVGIDYGSKLAGTTCLCFDLGGKLYILQSKKKQDADTMILDWVSAHNPELVMIDAPLSLPSAYTNPDKADYHFRQCDRKLSAMSPMFLGGLTARAMSLRRLLQPLTVLETYPKQVATYRLDNLENYKKHLDGFAKQIHNLLPYPIDGTLLNWHQADSVLAWYAGYLFTMTTESIHIGDPEEGLIFY